MHFWNKLSTAALMRLTVLASLNLIMGRVVGSWVTLLHPIFFLIIVTLNLGLYAVMVYSGTLNKTLIAMMLAGLASVLALIAVAGADASAFSYGGPYRRLAVWSEDFVNKVVGLLPGTAFRSPPKRFWGRYGMQVAHIAVDVFGLGMILLSGLVARALHGGTVGGATAPPRPSS